MTISYSINNTNQHQHKLRSSKKIARRLRAIYPKIPRTLETSETSETADPESSVGENLSMREAREWKQLLSLSVKRGILWGKLVAALTQSCYQTALNIICL